MEIERIKREGLVEGVPLTSLAVKISSPRITSNGDLYFIKNDQLSSPSLMKLEKGQDQAQKITRVYGNRFDYHPKSGGLLVQITPHGQESQFADLYQINLETGESVRLTKGARYRFASWSPDGTQILAVKNHLNQSALHLLDQQGQLIEILWQGNQNEVISHPDWSAQGNQIVASVKRKDQAWNLELFSLEKKQWRSLTQNLFIEGQPQFGLEGKQIIYTADYEGVFNIYTYQLETRVLKKLTHVVGGAFQPQLSIDRKSLVYLSAGPQGFDLSRLSLSNQGKLFLLPSSPEKYSTEVKINRENKQVVQDYNPTDSFSPTWWFPFLSFTESQSLWGFMTSANDPLQHHQFSLLLAYESQQGLPVWNFNYAYQRFRPWLQFSSMRGYSYRTSAGQTKPDIRQQTESSINAVYSLPSLGSALNLRLGFTHFREEDYRISSNALSENKVDNLVSFAVSYTSVQQAVRAIAPTEGSFSTLIYENSDLIEGDYEGSALILEQGGYLNLGNNHLLGARIALGIGEKDSRPFILAPRLPTFIAGEKIRPLSNGGEKGFQTFSRNQYSLPGYSEEDTSLQGNRMIHSSLEWNFPLWLIERGITAPPVGIRQFHGSLFFQLGDAWNIENEEFEAHRSLGLSLTTETILGYRFPFNIRTGIVKALDEEKSPSWFLSFSNPI